MRGLVIFGSFVCAGVAVEGLFRWSNGLELGWGWAGYRAAMLVLILLVTGWANRREARRERASGGANGSVGGGVFALVFGGAGLFVWGWRAVEALLTGRIIVSTTPDIYTVWSANRRGFAVAFGLDVLAVLFFLAIFAVGVLIVGDWLARREMAARP